VPPVLVHAARRPIVVDGKRVGDLLFDNGPVPGGIEEAFLAERTRDLYVAACVALVLSGLVGTLLARSILAPIRLVTEGARRLASGAFDTRLTTTRRDELGALVGDFNRMAAALEQSEEARRLWVADTSHELRTPLAVMQAQIEALQDGIHANTPAALARLHGEVLRMTGLVADLHELARADSHALALRLEPVDPGLVLQEVVEGFSVRIAASALQVHTENVARTEARVLADPMRLRQVFGNLMENAIRYTDAGGRIEITLASDAASVAIRVEDTAPGVPEPKLPFLFDRFYRVDASRDRRTGGSGLGLAICRAIVEAHGGTIGAAASPLGGLAVTVTLPRDDAACP
jgi:two-component system sensor histidine kinase BaeS